MEGQKRALIGKLIVVAIFISLAIFIALFYSSPEEGSVNQRESAEGISPASIYNIEFTNVPSESANPREQYYYPVKLLITDEDGLIIDEKPALELKDAPPWLNLDKNSNILEGIPPETASEETYKVILEASYEGSIGTKVFYIIVR